MDRGGQELEEKGARLLISNNNVNNISLFILLIKSLGINAFILLLSRLELLYKPGICVYE